ncbi:MAG: hypothetical protein LBV17_04135 [Treponema sp.]|jgi:hypothetical protein|nr:hypothetical protein [Treponema sp.]
MDIKKEFDRFKDQGSFLKVTSSTPVESAQKAVLNRKGNQMYNDGNVEGAKKVFLTTKYSDGLSRVGDYYKSQNKPLEALQMYWLAPDKTKSQPLIEQVAAVLQGLILEDEDYGVFQEGQEQHD